jgi:hypothetical protein
MRYFTRDWANGELDDGAADLVWPEYLRDLQASFDPAGPVCGFAASVSLNDAYVDRLTIRRSSNEVRLLLLTGSLQVGYWRTELVYSGGRIAQGEDVLRSALELRPTEIWYDEFAWDRDGGRHSFLLVPSGPLGEQEFQIAFDGFDYVQAPAGDRVLATPDNQSVWG